VQGNLEAGCAGAETPALLERAGEVFSTWRAQLAELLIAGGVPGARAPRLASLMISMFEGATALARAEKSLEPFDLAVSEVRRAVEEATSKADSRHPRKGRSGEKRRAK
jgi:TetR/AcrR family transcriptional regulator, lmrAB and yxaGH operons repressor